MESMEKKRIGLLENEILEFCKMADIGESCLGISCEQYSKCWKDLEPNEEGYFNIKRNDDKTWEYVFPNRKN